MSKQISYKILVSLLSADFARLGDEATSALVAGADGIHFDVMDNHYVPNLTLGPIGCRALRRAGITAPIDVHLMTKPVDNLIAAFAQAGATSITIHPEATDHLDRSLQLIQDHECGVGLALNPATPLNYLDHVLEKLDLILVMSVNPGFGGQSFISSSLEKIKKIKSLITNSALPISLMVDGGIKVDNIQAVANAGANQFVVGSALFESENYKETMNAFRKALDHIEVE